MAETTEKQAQEQEDSNSRLGDVVKIVFAELGYGHFDCKLPWRF